MWYYDDYTFIIHLKEGWKTLFLFLIIFGPFLSVLLPVITSLDEPPKYDLLDRPVRSDSEILELREESADDAYTTMAFLHSLVYVAAATILIIGLLL
jgi:hypothetical protein